MLLVALIQRVRGRRGEIRGLPLRQGRRAQDPSAWSPPPAWEAFAVDACPVDFEVWDEIRPWLDELGQRLGGARFWESGNNRVVYTGGAIPTGHVLKVSPGLIGTFQDANRAEAALWATEDTALREFLAPVVAHSSTGLWLLQVRCGLDLDIDDADAENTRWLGRLCNLFRRGLDLTPDADAVNMGVLHGRYVLFDYGHYHVRKGAVWPTAYASPRTRPVMVKGHWTHVAVQDWPPLPSYCPDTLRDIAGLKW